MTGDETKLILRFLRGCYPAFYRNMDQLEKDCVFVAWSTLFADDWYTYDMVFDAVRQCVSGKLRVRDGIGTREVTDGAYRRFPPQPGIIVEALEEGRESSKYTLRLKAKRISTHPPVTDGTIAAQLSDALNILCVEGL